MTGYIATASPGGLTCTASAAATNCTISGLSAGSTYTLTVTAANSVGIGPASTGTSGTA